jgi:hypothetical protein
MTKVIPHFGHFPFLPTSESATFSRWPFGQRVFVTGISSRERTRFAGGRFPRSAAFVGERCSCPVFSIAGVIGLASLSPSPIECLLAFGRPERHESIDSHGRHRTNLILALRSGRKNRSGGNGSGGRNAHQNGHDLMMGPCADPLRAG